jgi:hypothetical protein
MQSWHERRQGDANRSSGEACAEPLVRRSQGAFLDRRSRIGLRSSVRRDHRARGKGGKAHVLKPREAGHTLKAAKAAPPTSVRSLRLSSVAATSEHFMCRSLTRPLLPRSCAKTSPRKAACTPTKAASITAPIVISPHTKRCTTRQANTRAAMFMSIRPKATSAYSSASCGAFISTVPRNICIAGGSKLGAYSQTGGRAGSTFAELYSLILSIIRAGG